MPVLLEIDKKGDIVAAVNNTKVIKIILIFL